MDAYNPVYKTDSITWFPGNPAADEIVHLSHIWQDIIKLNYIRLRFPEDEIGGKLIFKYILIEFRSALDHARKLQGIIQKSPKLIKGLPAPWRYVTKEDLRRTRSAYKNLWRDLAPQEALIADIRNKIGAHRLNEPWHEIEELWSKIDAERFMVLLNRIPELIAVVKELNIYEWSWLNSESGVGSIFGSRVVHDWHHAFNPEEVEKTL